MNAIFPLPEGDVVVRIPNDLSLESLNEIGDFLQLLMRTVSRDVAINKSVEREKRTESEVMEDERKRRVGIDESGLREDLTRDDAVLVADRYTQAEMPVWVFCGSGDVPCSGKCIKASKVSLIEDSLFHLECGWKLDHLGLDTVIPGESAARTPIKVGDYGVITQRGETMFFSVAKIESMYKPYLGPGDD